MHGQTLMKLIFLYFNKLCAKCTDSVSRTAAGTLTCVLGEIGLKGRPGNVVPILAGCKRCEVCASSVCVCVCVCVCRAELIVTHSVSPMFN